MSLLLIGIALALLVVALYWHLKHHFSQFEKLNIPGPKPNLFIGNMQEILQKGQLKAIIDWKEKYGKIFGCYEGYTPVLSVSDPNILREILVKDSQNFLSRKPFPLAPRKSLGLFLENGTQWKHSRSMLNPAFSSGKLKQMFDEMNISADILLTNMKKQKEQNAHFDIYSFFQCLTLDVIGKCAFGIRTDAQTDSNDPFLCNIRNLFNGLSKSMILPAVMVFPLLQYFIFAVKNIVFLFGMNPVVWLRTQLQEVIKIRERLGNDNSFVDLVHLMLFPDKKKGGASSASKMSDRHIIAQSMTFLLAGYETTSTVLTYISHVLAQYPRIQRALADEIDRCVGKETITYESIQSLPYFDMVFNEVCRLYPTASLIVTRQATKTVKYNDVTIPNGMCVQANVWSLHRDEEYWEQPEEFNPERFSSSGKQDIHPYSFLPFGAGPRNCIGMRFAMMEIKITLIKLLQQFRLETCSHTSETLDVEVRGAIVPKGEVILKLADKWNPSRGHA